jgi:hypothetical protein
MDQESVRTSIEQSIASSEPKRPKKRLNLDRPIVPSRGKPFDLTNDQIYALIELP